MFVNCKKSFKSPKMAQNVRFNDSVKVVKPSSISANPAPRALSVAEQEQKVKENVRNIEKTIQNWITEFRAKKPISVSELFPEIQEKSTL